MMRIDSPIKITEHLFLGNFRAAEYDNLKKCDIPAVLCLTNDSHVYPDDIHLYHIDDISDELTASSFDLKKLENAVGFIEQQIHQGHNVLVHCMAGSSRSPTAIIAYIIKHHNLTVNEACLFVRNKAQYINPTFMDLLDEYYVELHR